MSADTFERRRLGKPINIRAAVLPLDIDELLILVFSSFQLKDEPVVDHDYPLEINLFVTNLVPAGLWISIFKVETFGRFQVQWIKV